MNRPLRILVTGGTGFLGRQVLPRLERLGTFTCISRRAGSGRLQADLTMWDGGIDPTAIRDQFDVLLHMAALYDLRAGQIELMKQNVAGTHNALVIAQKARIPHVVHIGTVAVTVGETGVASEDEFTRGGRNVYDPLVTPEMLDTSRPFPDAYSKSKAFAEHLVKFWSSHEFESKLVIRLGILTGDTKTGAIERIDGPYHSARFLEKRRSWIEKIPGPIPLPGIEGRTVPVLPVDVAAENLVKLIEISRAQAWTGYKCLHLFPSEGLSARAMYESALRYLGLGHREVKLIERLPKPVLKELGRWIGDIPREEVEYLLSMPRLDTSETERLLGSDWWPAFEDYEQTFWKGYREYVQNR